MPRGCQATRSHAAATLAFIVVSARLRNRALAGLTAAALAAALPVAEAAAPKRPSGEYKAGGSKVLLLVARGSIDVASFAFPCRGTTGRTSLNTIPIVRKRGRYRFSIRSFGLVTYADDHPDENGRVTLSGRFSTSARTAVGTLVVRSPHCGTTREITWTARR